MQSTGVEYFTKKIDKVAFLAGLKWKQEEVEQQLWKIVQKFIASLFSSVAMEARISRTTIPEQDVTM